MTHTCFYNSELHVVETKVQGDLTLDEIREIVTEIALIAKEKDCFLLFSDYREVTLKLSIMEIYGLPKITTNAFASLGLDILRCSRALVAASDLNDYSFHENVMVNRGQNVKVFFDIDKAKKWLLRK